MLPKGTSDVGNFLLIENLVHPTTVVGACADGVNQNGVALNLVPMLVEFVRYKSR
jgi:hypothetical protein